MKEYNLKQLVSIEVFDKSKSKDYFYVTQKFDILNLSDDKIIKSKDGVYENILSGRSGCGCRFICSNYSDNVFFEKHMVDDDTFIIYNRPRIVLSFSNGDVAAIYTYTIEDAIQKIDEIKSDDNNQWLKV